MREVVTPKGSRFFFASYPQTNPDYPKYPPQPIMGCEGHLPEHSGKGRHLLPGPDG